MSDERILEMIENQDKYYMLGFIQGLKSKIEILQQENAELEKENQKLKRKIEKLNESCEMFRSFLYYADLAYKESQQKINGDVEDE